MNSKFRGMIFSLAALLIPFAAQGGVHRKISVCSAMFGAKKPEDSKTPQATFRAYTALQNFYDNTSIPSDSLVKLRASDILAEEGFRKIYTVRRFTQEPSIDGIALRGKEEISLALANMHRLLQKSAQVIGREIPGDGKISRSLILALATAVGMTSVLTPDLGEETSFFVGSFLGITMAGRTLRDRMKTDVDFDRALSQIEDDLNESKDPEVLVYFFDSLKMTRDFVVAERSNPIVDENTHRSSQAYSTLGPVSRIPFKLLDFTLSKRGRRLYEQLPLQQDMIYYRDKQGEPVLIVFNRVGFLHK